MLLFSSKKYKPVTLELTSKRSFDDEIVIITITFSSIIDKGNHVAIHIFNLLLCKCLLNLNLSLVGRNYYDADAKLKTEKIMLIADIKKMDYEWNFKNREKKSYIIEGDECELVYLVPKLCTLTRLTERMRYDFYLVSQHVSKGTVMPTHYNVIMDTLNKTCAVTITPDILQKLTYRLTHMYYNWSGTVRVPALCKLAHKLAFLAATTLRNPPNPGLEDLLYFI